MIILITIVSSYERIIKNVVLNLTVVYDIVLKVQTKSIFIFEK